MTTFVQLSFGHFALAPLFRELIAAALEHRDLGRRTSRDEQVCHELGVVLVEPPHFAYGPTLGRDFFLGRDLLFARLLQYRAFKDVSAIFAERMEAEARRFPRAVGPPEQTWWTDC